MIHSKYCHWRLTLHACALAACAALLSGCGLAQFVLLDEDKTSQYAGMKYAFVPNLLFGTWIGDIAPPGIGRSANPPRQRIEPTSGAGSKTRPVLDNDARGLSHN